MSSLMNCVYKKQWANLGKAGEGWLRPCSLKLILHPRVGWGGDFVVLHNNRLTVHMRIPFKRNIRIFIGWIGHNSHTEERNNVVTITDGLEIISHKAINNSQFAFLWYFYSFIDVWQTNPACSHYFLSREELQDLTAKDLSYLILGPGHIWAVCWRWLGGPAGLLANHATAKAISSVQLHKGPGSRWQSSSGS